MKILRRSSLFLAISLSGLAGYVDALGFVYIQGYFVSFMSGNSTRLAVHLAHRNIPQSLFLLELILGFIVGAMLGAFISQAAGSRQRFAILASVGFLLLLASFIHELGLSHAAVFCMTLSMGIVNAVFQLNGKVFVPVTYMTGALIQVGQKMAYALLGKDRYGWLPPLLLWLGLVTGGFIGSMAYAQLGLHGLSLAAVFAFVLSALNLGHRVNESERI